MQGVYVIENDELRVSVSELGAQMQEIVLKRSGDSILWNGDPAVWQGRAPWLFPFVGQMRDGYYLVDGQKYEIPMHGFARKMRFSLERRTDRELSFALRDTDETRAVYPWRFELTVSYRLEGARLDIACTVRNADAREMYYSIGGHPGFVCKNGDQLVFADWPSLPCRRLGKGTHLMEQAVSVYPLDRGALTLRPDLFAEDAMLLEKPALRAITLRRQDGADVRLSFDAVPWLGIWSRAAEDGLRYVCIEPWLGVDDRAEADHLVEHKEAIQRLAAGEAHTFSMAIEPA